MGKASRKSERSTREKAAELRKQSEASRLRRERTTKIVVGAGVLLAAGGIVGVAALAASQGGGATTNPASATADPNAPLPEGVIPAGEEYEYGFPVGQPASDEVPTLQVWEDFQCPACGTIEKLNGRGIKDLGTSGRARVILQPTTFLDASSGTENSLNITAAWGCAIDQGKGLEYHATIFDNQPTRQGEGWSQEKIVEMAGQAGISGAGLEEFKTCVQDGTYRQWALNSTSLFYANNIEGTPTGIINGTETIKGQILGDQVELEKALFGDTTGQE